MHDRRLVGIDLGITSVHTVRVLAGDGTIVCRRKAVPTIASLVEVEQAALTGATPGTCLEVVLEPTEPSWLPIAVFFGARGHGRLRSQERAHRSTRSMTPSMATSSPPASLLRDHPDSMLAGPTVSPSRRGAATRPAPVSTRRSVRQTMAPTTTDPRSARAASQPPAPPSPCRVARPR
jgi:hypothetical protein